MAKTFGEAAIEVERRELGVKESPAGSNNGPRVSVYLHALGHGPEPWCADFQEWCLEQIGWERGDWNVSYCPSWVQAAREGAHGMRVLAATELPQVGDLALFDWDNDGVADHIGMIETVQGVNAFTSIEGNTSVSSDSNGGEVMRRTRSRLDTVCIIRLPDMVPPTLPTRIKAAGYGTRSVRYIVRNLALGVSGDVPRPNDRETYRKLRLQGLGHSSAKKVVKANRKKAKA